MHFLQRRVLANIIYTTSNSFNTFVSDVWLCSMEFSYLTCISAASTSVLTMRHYQLVPTLKISRLSKFLRRNNFKKEKGRIASLRATFCFRIFPNRNACYFKNVISWIGAARKKKYNIENSNIEEKCPSYSNFLTARWDEPLSHRWTISVLIKWFR